MGSSYLTLVENFFNNELQVDFNSNTLNSCERLSKEQLSFFNEHWNELDRNLHEEMVKHQPWTPRILDTPPSLSKIAAESVLRNQPTSTLFSHPYNGLKPIDLNLIKRQALFFSHVAVIAPQAPPIYGPGEPNIEFRKFFKRVLEIKPLIEDGTVELVPVFGFYSNEIEGGGGVVRAACKSDPNIMRWISSQQSALADFALTARHGDPFFDAGVRICSALAYGHSFAATHPFVGGLFKELLSDVPRMNRSKVVTTQHLEKIELPGLANLTWADIKAVRDNEESLIRWRADLQDAISNVDPYLEPEQFIERFDSQVQARLTKAAVELKLEIGASSAMQRFRKGTTEVAISAVAATATGFLISPVAGVWLAVQEVLRTDGPKEALRLLWESKGASGKRALRSHYAVFSGN